MSMNSPPDKAVFCTYVMLATLLLCVADVRGELKETDVLFRATFDKSADADFARGDKRIYTAESLAKKDSHVAGIKGDAVQWKPTGGRNGSGALHFRAATKQLTFFQADRNVSYKTNGFGGTVSFFMRLTPQEDLPKGYVDPLQITNKKWNDASFFVDFDNTPARDFRLGVFSDLKFWNPKNTDFEKIPVGDRPMVTVKQPPFSRDRWTHVAFTWSEFNTNRETEATLYLHGKKQGNVSGKQRFTWDTKNAIIMLGINFVGSMDELMILGRALSASEISELSK